MKTWQKLKQNPALWPQYLVREKVIDATRAFFKDQAFHEVETPILVERPSTESFIEFFDTQLEVADGPTKKGFLISSPEYALKKILVAGLERVFQIVKCFRNQEGLSSRHNPEFLMIEWYRTQADYTDIMRDCEQLLVTLLEKIKGVPSDGRYVLKYQGQEFDLTPPWPRISVAEAFIKYANIDTETLLDEKKLKQAAAQKGYQVTTQTTWEEAYHQVFLNEVEPALMSSSTPIILYDYPAAQAALSRRKASDPRFAERFEFYIAGLEIGNAFSELTDADEQETRLRQDLEERKKLGRKQYQLDMDFIEALRAGMPPAGGIAVGLDRLIMLLADTTSIHETMFFPVQDVFELG